MSRIHAVFVLSLLSLTACMPTSKAQADRPPMGWDARPEAAEWTQATLMAVEQRDSDLTETVPADIGAWCPGYAKASVQDRRAFWAGLMSATARYESSWNPSAAGGGGRYIGVMQISPRSADHHGCSADTVDELKDGAANLQCATHMMASSVAADGMVAGNGRQGIGREWMPFRDGEKRMAIAEWTKAQPYCQG